MKTLFVKTFGNLMGAHQYAEIICPLKNVVVRKLSRKFDKVLLDPMVPPVISVDLTTKITFQPWLLDRGNLLFRHEEFPGKDLKICTEADIIRYEDGSEYQINPDIR